MSADVHACPRCGLVLAGLAPEPVGSAYSIPHERDQQMGYAGSGYDTRNDARPTFEATTLDYVQNRAGMPTPAAPMPYTSPAPAAPIPARSVRSDNIAPSAPALAAPAVEASPAAAAGSRIVPRGAVELLPEESVAFQLGALYLTNKRVILLAPSVIRAAFLRDVDAVGTLTERSSGWTLFFGLLFLGLAGVGAYASIQRRQFEATFPVVYTVEPLFIAAALAIVGLALLVMYFVWVKRTLFISVSGRPLITVSVADWNSRKLEGMDGFVNAFFQMKDGVM